MCSPQAVANCSRADAGRIGVSRALIAAALLPSAEFAASARPASARIRARIISDARMECSPSRACRRRAVSVGEAEAAAPEGVALGICCAAPLGLLALLPALALPPALAAAADGLSGC